MQTHDIISTLQSAPKVRLVLLRGLPGSGKSTLARAILASSAEPWIHLEADAHFTDRNGHYFFDSTRVADAHAVCQQHAHVALAHAGRVVIANTHVRLWELSAYFGLSLLHGCDFRVIELRDTHPNIHDVSDDIIAKMRKKWEPLPEAFSPKLLIHSEMTQNPT